jgi:hypothetical protein
VLSTAQLLNGCGTVGPPIAPEDVGIGPLMEQQDRARAQQAGQRPPSPAEPAEPGTLQPVEPLGQDDVLPPLRPVGGR